MAQIASALFFMFVFVGCGAALHRMVAEHLDEVAAALLGPRAKPVLRQFRVTVRPGPTGIAAGTSAVA